MKKNIRSVNIWYTYLTKEFQLNNYDSFLSKLPCDIRHSIIKFRRWQDAQASLLGKCMIAHNIFGGGYDKLKLIYYNEFKKPMLNEIHFNISHAGNIVVLVTWENQIGIDVELIRSIDVSDFKEQMTTLEWLRIQQSNDCLISFFNYWTEKEAVVKAVGKGLVIPFKSFKIIDNYTVIERTPYYIKKIHIDKDYVCHIASPVEFENVMSNIRFFDLSNVLSL